MEGRIAWMDLFRYIDKNTDSGITKEEWSSAFDSLDANHDGVITRKEWFLQRGGNNYLFDKVVAAASSAAGRPAGLSAIATIKQSDWAQAFDMFDIDGDGTISEQDWQIFTNVEDLTYPIISLEEYTRDPNFWYINSQFPGLQAISKDPWIFLVHDFLTAAEVETLLLKGGDPWMDPSEPDAGEVRTSTSISLAYSETPGLHKKFAKLLGASHGDTHSQLECLTIVKYQAGQEFKEHTDAHNGDHFAEELLGWDGFEDVFGGGKCINRIATVWVYLNDVLEGGLTSFPHIDLKIQPKRGMAVVHFPAFMHTAPGPFHDPAMQKGYPDMRVLHAAEPAVHEKFICVAAAYPMPMELGNLCEYNFPEVQECHVI